MLVFKNREPRDKAGRYKVHAVRGRSRFDNVDLAVSMCQRTAVPETEAYEADEECVTCLVCLVALQHRKETESANP